MPPVNDNFANAVVLGLSGSGVYDNTGATSDGANDPLVNLGYGSHTIWFRIPNPGVGKITVGTDTGGGSPIVDSTIGVYYGTTLAGLTQIAIDDDSGPGYYSQITNASFPGAGDDLYIEITGFDDTYEGTFTLTWSFTSCVIATDVLNPDSPSASAVSGRVRETDLTFYDWSSPIENQPEAALKWTWTGATGYYQVSATGIYADPGAAFQTGSPRIMVAVNGVPIIQINRAGTFVSYGTDITWTQYDGLSGGGGSTYNEDDGTAPWVPLKTGDLIEVFIVSTAKSVTPTWIPFDLELVCFTLDSAATNTAQCTGVFAWPQDPLGDAWGSPNGWGGQQFVPDQIWTQTGITPYDEGNASWGVNWADYDFVALSDGTVYAVVHDAWSAGAGSPSTTYSYIVVKKYNPNTDTWSQIDTLNVNDPTSRYMAEAVSCEYDGTYIYFVWWELDSYSTSGSFPTFTHQWKWHCKRLDPTDDSITELGTGQNAYTAVITNYPTSVLACGIACSGTGDIYVSALESNESWDGVNSFTYTDPLRIHVWRWNGSTWSDLSLPDPSVTQTGWEVRGENSFYDVLGPMVAARQAGPCTDGFTIAYEYVEGNTSPYNAHYRTVTIDYTVGSGWGSEILSDWATIEGDPRLIGEGDEFTSPYQVQAYSHHAFDISLLWSANLNKLLLVADLKGITVDAPWDVFKMNDAGTQWTPISSIAPAEVTGNWRQSHNTAAIGPDGEVYRATFSDSIYFNFEPKILKTSLGYLADFAVGAAPGCGEVNPTYIPYMEQTTQYRIRIVGTSAYVMCSLATSEYNYTTQTGGSGYADGIFMFKLTWNPCGGPLNLSGVRFRAFLDQGF